MIVCCLVFGVVLCVVECWCQFEMVEQLCEFVELLLYVCGYVDCCIVVKVGVCVYVVVVGFYVVYDVCGWCEVWVDFVGQVC